MQNRILEQAKVADRGVDYMEWAGLLSGPARQSWLAHFHITAIQADWKNTSKFMRKNNLCNALILSFCFFSFFETLIIEL